MLRKYAIMSALAAASITGFAGVAQAQYPSKSSEPARSTAMCVTITEPGRAQRLRLDALNVERSSLRNQLAAATEFGEVAEAKRLNTRIATITTRISRVEVGQLEVKRACAA
jgi:hypothetical protein